MEKNCVLFITHINNDFVRDYFLRVKKQLENMSIDLYMVYNSSEKILYHNKVFNITNEEFKQKADKLFTNKFNENAPILGNAFNLLKLIYDKIPNYEYYFYMEYDTFSIKWNLKFESILNKIKQKDVIIDKLRKQTKSWYWTKFSNVNEDDVYQTMFNFIGFSNKAIINLWNNYFFGHFELVVGTLIKELGLNILEYRGDTNYNEFHLLSPLLIDDVYHPCKNKEIQQYIINKYNEQ